MADENVVGPNVEDVSPDLSVPGTPSNTNAANNATVTNDKADELKAELESLRAFKAEAEKSQTDAKKKALIEQNKWQELAEAETKRVGELSSEVEARDGEITHLKNQLESYTKMLKAQVDNQKKNLPDEVKALLDGVELDKQVEWLNEHSAKYGTTAKTAPPPSPDSNGTNVDQAKLDKARKNFAGQIRSFL